MFIHRPFYSQFGNIQSVIILNLADHINSSLVRFRECELHHTALDDMSSLSLPHMFTGKSLGNYNRLLDSKRPPSAKMQAIMKNYTLQFPFQQFITLDEFKKFYVNVCRDEDYQQATM